MTTPSLSLLSTIPIEWISRLLVAALCGIIIGIEREINRKAAGIRTNAMICMGACLYVLAADLMIARLATLSAAHYSVDPSRMAGQVVVGMGFIGAGTIIQSRGRITGLTSAATMWVVAAIGIVVGIGYPIFGLVVTAITVVILFALGRLEFLILGKCTTTQVRLSFQDRVETWDAITHICRVYSKNTDAFPRFRTTVAGKSLCFLDIAYCDVHPSHREFVLELLKIPDVRQAGIHALGAPEEG